MVPEEWDVMVIGAGLTGINAAYRLRTELPDLRLAVLEAKEHVGGTWAFWRYPGFRTDSAMAVFGYAWHPWPHDTEFGTGEQIHAYLEDAVAQHDLAQYIHLQHRVTSACWSSDEQRWTVSVKTADGAVKTVKTWLLLWCSGYYDYNQPLKVDIPGLDRFGGEVVHPQFWTDDVDYAGKKVVLVGSGATAITVLPELVKTAKHVTMLQRSPSYVFSLKNVNPIDKLVRRWLPAWSAASLTWWMHLIQESLFVGLLTRWPDLGRRLLRSRAKAQLPPDIDVDVHFNPNYVPFDQRLCLCPDSDFFKALGRSNCDIITDVIDQVQPKGIQLQSSGFLDADMIITATGLHFQLLDNISPKVDGQIINIGERYAWRGTFLEGVPNSCAILGYASATWTPGADARVSQAIQVIKHMKKIGATSAVPVVENRDSMARVPVLKNSSTYFRVARDRMPLSADSDPWFNGTNWWSDTWNMWFADLNKGMKYTVPSVQAEARRISSS